MKDKIQSALTKYLGNYVWLHLVNILGKRRFGDFVGQTQMSQTKFGNISSNIENRFVSAVEPNLCKATFIYHSKEPPLDNILGKF